MTVATKLCTKCKEIHPTALFYAHKKTKDKLQGWCRMCMGEASKHNQGMKRIEKRELKDLMDQEELGYRFFMVALKKKYKEQLEFAAKKYHMETAKVMFDFGFRGDDYVKVERKAAEGPTEFGVRSTQP